MAQQLGALGPELRFPAQVAGLARRPLLVLTADDDLAAVDDQLAAAVRAKGGKVETVHAATDHSWNSRRVFLAAQVIGWLQRLPTR